MSTPHLHDIRNCCSGDLGRQRQARTGRSDSSSEKIVAALHSPLRIPKRNWKSGGFVMLLASGQLSCHTLKFSITLTEQGIGGGRILIFKHFRRSSVNSGHSQFCVYYQSLLETFEQQSIIKN